MSIPSPLQPRLRQILGFVAEGRLTRRGCLTALHFRSKQTHTYDFHQTRLRRGRRNSTWRSAAKLVLQLRALVSLVLGSLCQGPRIGFTFPCLPPILCAMLGAPSLLGVPVYACVARSLAPCTWGIFERALKRCPLERTACFAEFGGKCDRTLNFKMDSR